MEYRIIEKSHVYELLYPMVANVLGMSNLFMRVPSDMEVKYYSNSYCDNGDNADNAMSRLTVECTVRNRGTVCFVPSRKYPAVGDTGDAYAFEYGVYVQNRLMLTLSPAEWELIRPKVYGDFTEYFMEFSKAVSAYQQIAGWGSSARPFIVKHYGMFVRSFRCAIHTNLFKFSAASMTKPVEIMFNSENVSDLREHAVLTKTVNGRLMLIATSLN